MAPIWLSRGNVEAVISRFEDAAMPVFVPFAVAFSQTETVPPGNWSNGLSPRFKAPLKVIGSRQVRARICPLPEGQRKARD
jgi:hypothetical protein